MSRVASLVRSALPSFVTEVGRRGLAKLDPFVRLSYSQDGEDMVLRRMFEGRRDGFYVDVGAHHPFRFSNTCYFHRMGWRGLNIDANPNAIAAFKRARPDDINICVGIAETAGSLIFHQFNEPALDTFDPALADERAGMNGYRIVERSEIGVRPLRDVLEASLPSGQPVDFMSVDVEGFDLQVLRSNNWDRFRPKVLLVEARGANLDEIGAEPACAFARDVGYRAIAKTVNTVILSDAG